MAKDAYKDANKTVTILTDMHCSPNATKKVIKGIFLERDKIQMSSYVKDLEKTIEINKQIIAQLVAGEKEEATKKEIIEKLNAENAKLSQQLKIANKERDEAQSKILICEQLIEEYKTKDGEAEKQFNLRAGDLVEQLNRKEYFLQTSEKKLHKTLALLSKYIDKDPEVKALVRDLQVNPKEMKKITNVVQENEVLATEVRTARLKMAELQYKVTELSKLNRNNPPLTAHLPSVPSEEEQQSKPRIVFSRLPSHIQQQKENERVQALLKENQELKKNIERLRQEMDNLEEALKCMQQKNEALNRLNLELSEAIVHNRPSNEMPLRKSISRGIPMRTSRGGDSPRKQGLSPTKLGDRNVNRHKRSGNRLEYYRNNPFIANKLTLEEVINEDDIFGELSSIKDYENELFSDQEVEEKK